MIRFFAGHPTAANLLMIVFAVVGCFAIPGLKRETFPELQARLIEIRVAYPGATPQEIEDAVCGRIEDAIDGVSGIEEVRSEALEGSGRVTVVMLEGENAQLLLDDLRTEVDAIDDFPAGAEAPVIRQLGRTDLVGAVAITGTMPLPDLKAYAQQLKEKLQADPRVSLVEVAGFSDHQIRVSLSADVQANFGITSQDVADAIRRQSLDMPAGTVTTRERDVLVRLAAQRRTPLQFADVVVLGVEGGAEVRLGDIAVIEDVFELDEAKLLFNGQRAALLRVQKTRTQDTLEVIDAVKEFIAAESKIQPNGVTLTLTQDLSSVVRDRLQLLITNGWQGLLLVFLSLWLFFSLRLSFWVAAGLPVSFLGALFCMQGIGYSINMMTMVALLLALGLLMDDAIVLAENIATHRSQGKGALRAAIDGTLEVKTGVISSFATTVFVFGPMAFMSGEVGQVLRVLPVVLILVLLVSLVEAFLILPAHLAHAMHHETGHQGRFRRAFDARLDMVRQKVVGRCVDAFVAWRYLGVGVVAMVFLLSVGTLAGGWLKFRVFPDIEGDVVVARVLLPQGAPLRRTEEVVEALMRGLAATNTHFKATQPGGRDLVRNTTVEFNANADANETGAHVATVTADLLPSETRTCAIEDVLGHWRRAVGNPADVIQLQFTEPASGPAGRAIEVRFLGRDLEELQTVARRAQAWFAGIVGVTDLAVDLRPGKPELRAELRRGTMGLGLDVRTIGNQLRGAILGETVQQLQIGPEAYEVVVRNALADRDGLADLDAFQLTLPGGARVPLAAVADLRRARGYSRIARVNGVRTVTLIGDVDSRRANVAEVMAAFQTEFLPGLKTSNPAVRVTLEGETKSSATTGASLARAFLIGLIGMFVLLSFQFRSYLTPLVVIVTIPLCFIGVIWGHLLMGLDLTMPSMVGFVSLAGVVVNDSILLVEFIKMHIADHGVATAARQASRLRFRAVLLTSLTTIAGMVPLLLETSTQAQVLIPLATSIVFGLTASTLLVLIVTPALYTILGDCGLAGTTAEHAPSTGADAEHDG
ncbi:MAG: efflux RND transporter permease subunit [Planctomycetes bacterium]|nr:efflux RND transporter permease subunit [Planctomycetota bacterium]MCB9888330.1 efflux RND transporter permease subunit [Planctomycetota bacterium]